MGEQSDGNSYRHLAHIQLRGGQGGLKNLVTFSFLFQKCLEGKTPV